MAPRDLAQSATDYKPTKPDERTSFVELFPPHPPPKSELAKYRILSPTAGVRVSPLCFGAMSLGDQWTGYMGAEAGPEHSEKLLDTFYELCGNFIDTANNYQDEQSEMIVGEWMEKRGNRDEIVLATKYTTFVRDRAGERYHEKGIPINFVGNSRKSMKISVERSLKKLRTDYIDLLYVHWWDYTTSVDEVMRGLDDLVKSGKVLYLGVSDTPAWVVSEANAFARAHGLTPFSVYQGAWNLAMRDIEREIIPMCRANGMALAPWAVFGQGKFKTAAEFEKRAQTLRGGMKPSESELKMSQTLEEVSKELGGVGLTSIAMAWCRQTMFDCYPIVGGADIERLKENVEALKVHLTDEQMEKVSKAVPFDWGFPYSAFGRDPKDLPNGYPSSFLLNTVGHHQFSTRQ